MKSFTVHTGIAAPLRRSDIDTDQIIPGRFCRTHRKTGYAAGLFADWRIDPGFVLNLPRYTQASILVADENFGTGSSREHAVWALMDFGFRVVISPRFGDIFRANALMAGLLTVTLPPEAIRRLWRIIEDDLPSQVTVDLTELQVRAGDGHAESFQLEPDTRARLLSGLDQITVTMRYSDDIAEYERSRRPGLPVSVGAVTAGLSPRSPGSPGSP